MNGPEHYKAAERLLSDASFTTGNGAPGFRGANGVMLGGAAAVPMIEHAVAKAQVHATLALAAAQALSPITYSLGDTDRITEWAQATASSPTATRGDNQ